MKKPLVALALSAGLLASSCLGANRAFEQVHAWNQGFSENRWVGTGVHAAFWIIPVYPLCLAADIFVFNSIEFWTGENPITEVE